MSKTRNLSDLLDANGDVKSTALDNVPASDLVNDTSPQLGGDLGTNGNDIIVGDSDNLKVGSGGDMFLTHNGTNSYIVNQTGTLFLRGDDVQIESVAGENHLIGSANGAVNLYYDNSNKLQTTTNGVTVNGYVLAQGSTVGFAGDDNVKVQLGNSGDLQIYHDGSNSYVQDSGTGNLILAGSANIRLRPTGTGEDMLVANSNGSVDLYYDNSKKLETTSDGVTITGNLTTGFAPMALGYQNVVQSLTKNTHNKIVNWTDTVDTDSAFDTSTSRFTVPTGKAGKYMINWQLTFNGDNSANTGYDQNRPMIYKNGNNVSYADYVREPQIPYGSFPHTRILDLSAGDYLEFYFLPDRGAGSAGNTVANSGTTWFEIYRIST